MNTLSRFKLPAAVVSAVSALALTACGSHAEDDRVQTVSVAPPTAERVIPMLRFDSLGGGSSIIKTYRGAGESATDRQATGSTYNNGDEVPVECQETGRTVNSDTSVGEAPESSDVWYRFDKGREYATAVYGEIDPPNAVVPQC